MRIFERYCDELKALVSYVQGEAVGKPVLRVLEAGCGREWHIRPDGVKTELTGVDLDVAALEYRKRVKRDLDRAIVGDLRTVPLQPAHFDVVYSSFVLAHVDGAEKALDNMLGALKPGGLLIIRVPDLSGVQTFFSRHLPHWCAVAYYRHVWKIKKAGQPGFAPYPVHYDPVISIDGFREYCGGRQLSIIGQFGVGSYAARGSGFLSRIVPIAARLVSLASRGRVHDRYVDLTFVVRKMAN